MPTLHLIGIVCEKTQEAVDELFIKIDVDNTAIRNPVWEGRMNDGDARSVYWSRMFNEWIRIRLYERDNVGRHDHIDSLTIRATEPEAGEVSHIFMGDRGRYRLIYELRSGARDNTTLSLQTLHCNDAQEAADEPYITVNGVPQWGPEIMKTNDTCTVGKDVVFDRRAMIELWEKDPSLSEKIGTTHIVDRVVAPASGEPVSLTATFHSDRGIPGSASYTLRYTVRRRRP